MFSLDCVDFRQLTRQLSELGYWPAQASQLLEENRYSQVIELCRDHLQKDPKLVSGRLTYAVALYRTGQRQQATEQFYQVLAVDPDNVVALKYLGDIKFAESDEVSAMANYRRILEIDPGCQGLKSDLRQREKPITHTITLAREPERVNDSTAQPARRWKIHFYTETVGDLYMAQGHPRQAAEIFRRLYEKSRDPGLAAKLARAEGRTKEKESKDVC